MMRKNARQRRMGNMAQRAERKSGDHGEDTAIDVESPDSDRVKFICITGTHTIYINAKTVSEAYRLLRKYHPSSAHGRPLRLRERLPGGAARIYKFHLMRRIWWALTVW